MGTPIPAFPPLLLEKESEAILPLGGPGERFVLGPLPPPVEAHVLEESGRLPESYGSSRLLLTARDPRWLYAHWDLSAAQLRRFQALARDGHLRLRVFRESLAGGALLEIKLHKDARSWFAQVDKPGCPYVAELGCVLASGAWHRIGSSGVVFTPPDTLAEETASATTSLPPEVPLPQLVEVVGAVVREHPALERTLERSVPSGESSTRKIGWTEERSAIPQVGGRTADGLPSSERRRVAEPPTRALSPEQEKALAEMVAIDAARRVWLGSLEITELVRQHLEEAGPGAAGVFAAPPSSAAMAPSSGELPAIAAGAPGRFWFEVNAELVIYGATEPDAAVAIGGRRIKLRPDGSFSYRFALPDGHYELPIAACAADESDTRRVRLRFVRASEYEGDVGAHRQDPALGRPSPEHVS